MDTQQEQNPFKALYSYEEKDKDIFHGRDREARDLFKLVKLNTLAVVFGKSGIGKTSLINAGLFPRLRKIHFLPIHIRLDYLSSSKPLITQVVTRIQEELTIHGILEKKKELDEQAHSFQEGESLWEYFHRVEHVSKEGKLWTPVLVLDQFEEFFTIGENHPDREAFADELYYLAEDQVPEKQRERFSEDGEMYPYINTQSAVRVVLGLRENYLSNLNSLRHQIPSINKVLFQVIHLNGQQAREVISIPTGFDNEKIQDDILRQFYPEDEEPGKTIPDEKLEVEPALLSLLCHQMIEKKYISLSKQEKNNILADFYERELEKLSNSEELAEFIETRLLTDGGFRTPFYLHSSHQLRGAVKEAINRNILRKFYIGEKEHVEIIHDVLTPIIKERRDRRLEEKRKQEDRQRQKQKIYRIIAVAGIVSLLLAILAFVQKNRADRQYKKAVSNRLAAESSLALPKDNIKALRIAEAAYKRIMPAPLPSVIQALSSAAYSAYKRPFYTANMQHEDKVSSAVFSPDSSIILTTSMDKTAKLWDISGKFLTELKHPDHVSSAVFSPNGTKTLTVSESNTAKIWDLKGNLLTDSIKHNAKISSAVFSPNGSNILTASWDKTAKLWDLRGNLLADLKNHTDKVWSAVFSPDSSKILTVSDDNTAKLWDLNGNFLADLNQHSAHVSSAAFSPNSSKIVTASWDNTAKLWDLSGKLLSDLNQHSDYVWSAVFSTDGSKILTASSDKTAKLWDLNGNLLADLTEHADQVNSAVFSPDDSKILTRTRNAVKIWDLLGNLLTDLSKHSDDFKNALFSPDREIILTWSGNSAKLWDFQGKILVDLSNHQNSISNAAFSHDCSKIVTASWDNTAKLWDLKGNFITNLREDMKGINSAVFSPGGEKILTWLEDTVKLFNLKGTRPKELKYLSDLKSANLAPDGHIILTVLQDDKMNLRDSSGRFLPNLNESMEYVSTAVFSPDGSKVFTVSLDNTAKLFDLKGNLFGKLKLPMALNSAAVSPKCNRIIIIFQDNTVKLWNVRKKTLTDFNKQLDDVKNAVFSRDGTKIVIVSRDNSVKLCDLKGNLLADLNKHTGDVNSSVFSPDGSKILTAASDNTAKLWDLKGNLIADLNKHTDDVLSAVFNADGSRIITVSKDGTVKSWYTPEAIIKWLETAPIPKLSKEEKKSLGIENFETE